MQGLNEQKRVHQFKAYETLNSDFIEKYLVTYPKMINQQEIESATERLTDLFKKTVGQNDAISYNSDILKIADI